MRFAFTADQVAFAEGLGSLLDNECTAAVVREAWDNGSGHAPALWDQLGQLGLFGLLVPSGSGGLGGSVVDAVGLFERLGGAAVPGPVVEQIVVGGALTRPGVEAPGVVGVEDVASGSLVVTLASPVFGTGVSTSADADGAGGVPHAAVADAVVGPGGVRTGFTAVALPSLDGGRVLASVEGGSTAPVGGLEFGTSGWLADVMALALGAQLVGLAAAMIDQAAEYARQRHQFGKPIGSFQAVKHLLADALLAVDFARAPLWRAAWSIDEGMPTAPADVSAARVLTDAAATKAARSALQVHGAIGYTWECDLHLWMKKVWALCPSWGDATWHRRRVSQWLLEGKGPVCADGETMPGLEQLR